MVGLNFPKEPIKVNIYLYLHIQVKEITHQNVEKLNQRQENIEQLSDRTRKSIQPCIIILADYIYLYNVFVWFNLRELHTQMAISCIDLYHVVRIHMASV